jgi:hypothetical protein
MPLKRRPVDRFRIISTQDEALDAVEDSIVRTYFQEGRDWEYIAPHIKGLDPPPTIFVCEPLKPAYDSAATSGETEAMRQIFAAHCKEILNAPDDMKPVYKRDGDTTYLDNDFVSMIPPNWFLDVARIIIERGMADVTPFSLPVGFWLRRSRRAASRLVGPIGRAASSIATASDDSSKSATKDEHGAEK